MKARVKATGEIVDIYEWSMLTTVSGDNLELGDVELENDSSFSLDYWEKLKHQAAIAAMPIAESIIDGLHSSTHHRQEGYFGMHTIDLFVEECVGIATALVNRLKEEEK